MGSREPEVTVEELEKNPSLAEYVLKRPETHERGVVIAAKSLLKEQIADKAAAMFGEV